MSSKRLFVAIPIPDALRQVLASCSSSIANPDIRWIPPENLHITLLFIGNVKEEKISDMKQKLATIVETASFQLQCEAITAVKRRGRVTMVWARFTENPQFVRLATQVSSVLAVPSDHYPLPHVTLARVKQHKHIKIDNTVFPPIHHLQFDVNTLGLWESELKPAGSVYAVLAEWRLY